MLASPLVDRLLSLALEEDTSWGDITAELSVPAAHRSIATILARERQVVCGLPLIARLCAALDVTLTSTLVAQEGSWVESESVLARIEGSTRSLLMLERTLLNLLQRMSGVASYTAEFVAGAGSIVVLDTRKTLPGWRVLDKYATRTGGARNHRLSLGDMVLVKNNHIDARGGDLRGVLTDIRKGKPLYMPLEIEVRNATELALALEFAPTAVMLDNMNDQQLEESLAYCRTHAPQVLVEVSGGITAARIARLQSLRVPAISIGALTTQARNRDISLRIRGDTA